MDHLYHEQKLREIIDYFYLSNKGMMNLKYSIGIDVSKKDFHCCLSVIDSSQKVTVKSSRKLSNSPGGFKEFLA
ncbi:hypothetical protein J7E50_25270, partial [Pedobacter sp. ISL-68]|nr:hypothetical protein [Pedobacter sp. ISL-68]